MSWIDNIKEFFTRSQTNLPWAETFKMQKRAPLIANRLFDSLGHMEDFLKDDSSKASAFIGMVLSVNHKLASDDSGAGSGEPLDGDDGLYLVTGVGSEHYSYKKIATSEQAQNIICKTTAEFNIDQTVYPEGTLLVYTDRTKKLDPNTGEVLETYVGIKAGCGKIANQTKWVDAYKVSASEFKTAQEIVDEFYGHKNDDTIHHTIGVDRNNETLVFSGQEVNI